jgi:hypothetical protein
MGVSLALAGPASSSPASGRRGAEKPGLLNQFLVEGYQTGPRTEVVLTPVSLCPGLHPAYPQLKSVIPGVRVTLYLPKGVRPLKATYTIDRAKPGKQRIPASNLHWSLRNGHPTWVLRNVGADPATHWNLVVQLPRGMKTFAVTATGAPLGIPNAPVQRTSLRLKVHPCSAGCWPAPRNRTS